MVRSRLSRRQEKQTRKNLILSIIGILIVLFLLIKFGLPLLINFSLFLSGKPTEESNKSKSNVFIAPPLLNSLPQATNSAQMAIKGNSSPNYTIQLYLNNELIDETRTKKDGTFSFEETLSTGENTVKAKAKADNKFSDFSQISTVIFSNTAPKLEISTPTDGQSFSKDQNFIDVKGTTDPDARVTVNGFWAIIHENNSFLYTLGLQNGENKISVIATDQAGNKTEKEIKVSYSP